VAQARIPEDVASEIPRNGHKNRGKRSFGGNTGRNTENLAPPWTPGQSGPPSGRPQGDARMRRLMLKTLEMSNKEAIAALCRRWRSTKHVQDMVELLARLEGEMNKDGHADSRGISLLILNNQGPQPLAPEAFREAVLKR